MSDQIGRGRSWFAYRCYDKHGVLLYSGSTSNVERRMKEHRLVRRWTTLVARVEIEEFDSRWRATLAERSYGCGRFGLLPGGISKGLAAAMTDDELIEALNHPAYCDDVPLYTAGVHWGLGMQRARELLAAAVPETKIAEQLGVDRMTVRRWVGK